MAEPTTSLSVYRSFASSVWTLQLRPTQKLVLLAWTEFRLQGVHPSQEALALATGLSSRQIRSVLARLVEADYLRVVANERHEGVNAHPREYALNESRIEVSKPADIPNNLQGGARRRRREKLIKESGARCYHCGRFGTDESDPQGEPWHIDRLVPRARGGRYEEGNVVLSCSSCNRRKGMTLKT